MEWVGRYEQLNNSEKQAFTRIVNLLLAKTFLLREDYDLKEGRVRVHPDYRFVDRLFDVFSEYLAVAGFALHRDSGYGVMSLASLHDYNKYQFSKFTTMVLLTLRLIFEEKRESVSLRQEVMLDTHELVSKMQVLGVIDKRPAMKDLATALKQLASFNLVMRLDGGKWESPDTRLMLLPSILFIIPNDRLSQVLASLDDRDDDSPSSDAGVDQASDTDAGVDQASDTDTDADVESDADLMEDV